jgi:hypothetical protein
MCYEWVFFNGSSYDSECEELNLFPPLPAEKTKTSDAVRQIT